MKYIIAKSRYDFVEEVLIPLDEISTIELRKDGKVVVCKKHGNDFYYIDKETYYDLKSNPSKKGFSYQN